MSIVQNTQNNQWVSVEDRFPEFNKKVLVCVNGYDIYVDEYIDRGYAEYFVVWHGCVTHWQPLPPPPIK